MKSYILKLLAQSDSEEAKMLTEIITMFDMEYEASPIDGEDYFTLFIEHNLETDKLFQFCFKHSNNGKQVIEGTPVCWKIRDHCFASIWLE